MPASVRMGFLLGLLRIRFPEFVHSALIHRIEPVGQDRASMPAPAKLMSPLSQGAGQKGAPQPKCRVQVSPALVEVHEEDHVIPEAGQPVRGGHGNDEGEDVIDEGIEGLWGRWRVTARR